MTNKNCNYCDSCDSCYYCKNLKMTEYNLFCRSEKCNDENSFQQKKYRVFNVEVTEEEYKKINIPKHKLVFDSKEDHETRYKTSFKNMREWLTKEQKQAFFDIPHFDAKWFQFITGIDVESQEEEKEIIEVNGKKYQLID